MPTGARSRAGGPGAERAQPFLPEHLLTAATPDAPNPTRGAHTSTPTTWAVWRTWEPLIDAEDRDSGSGRSSQTPPIHAAVPTAGDCVKPHELAWTREYSSNPLLQTLKPITDFEIGTHHDITKVKP